MIIKQRKVVNEGKGVQDVLVDMNEFRTCKILLTKEIAVIIQFNLSLQQRQNPSQVAKLIQRHELDCYFTQSDIIL
jgi:hypothetical protein